MSLNKKAALLAVLIVLSSVAFVYLRGVGAESGNAGDSSCAELGYCSPSF